MTETANESLLETDKFMPEMDLIQPSAVGKSEFTYSACRLLIKKKKE